MYDYSEDLIKRIEQLKEKVEYLAKKLEKVKSTSKEVIIEETAAEPRFLPLLPQLKRSY